MPVYALESVRRPNKKVNESRKPFNTLQSVKRPYTNYVYVKLHSVKPRPPLVPDYRSCSACVRAHGWRGGGYVGPSKQERPRHVSPSSLCGYVQSRETAPVPRLCLPPGALLLW